MDFGHVLSAFFPYASSFLPEQSMFLLPSVQVLTG
jgi:hypothetical protein